MYSNTRPDDVKQYCKSQRLRNGSPPHTPPLGRWMEWLQALKVLSDIISIYLASSCHFIQYPFISIFSAILCLASLSWQTLCESLSASGWLEVSRTTDDKSFCSSSQAQWQTYLIRISRTIYRTTLKSTDRFPDQQIGFEKHKSPRGNSLATQRSHWQCVKKDSKKWNLKSE